MSRELNKEALRVALQNIMWLLGETKDGGARLEKAVMVLCNSVFIGTFDKREIDNSKHEIKESFSKWKK